VKLQRYIDMRVYSKE